MSEDDTRPLSSHRRYWWLLVVAFALFYAWELVRTAWLADDAYITLRTVDNFIHGYGLRWNIAERVQSYTHPLWMFVLSAGYFVTREEFYTTIAISMLCSLAAFVLLMTGLTRNPREAAMAGLCLIASKAFVDFSSSGLENPLTHLIFVAYFIVYLREIGDHRDGRLLALALLACLGMLNRLDTTLIFGPPLAWAWWRCRGWKTLGLVMAGIIPLLAWEVFAIVYYGFPFPNTAYAKLSGEVPARLLTVFTGKYFWYTLMVDPQTYVVLVTGLAFAVRGKHRHLAPMVVGVGLYLAYLAKIGGDFMGGRFFALPVLAAVCLLLASGFAARARRWSLLCGFVLALGLMMQLSPILAGYDYSERAAYFSKSKWITDERGYYYDDCGLLHSFHNAPYPGHFMAEYARSILAVRGQQYTVTDLDMVGMTGFILGPNYHIVDCFGLSDAVLSRQPVVDLQLWRPGHSKRNIPNGYRETLWNGENVIEDPDLAQWYEELKVVISAPLFAPGRFSRIIGFNTGRYAPLLEHYRQEQLAYRKFQAEHPTDLIKQRMTQHLEWRAKWDDTVTTARLQRGAFFLPDRPI